MADFWMWLSCALWLMGATTQYSHMLNNSPARAAMVQRAKQNRAYHASVVVGSLLWPLIVIGWYIRLCKVETRE